MSVDYQVVVNMYTAIFAVAMPIGLVMLVGEKLLHIFQDFVLGRRVKV